MEESIDRKNLIVMKLLHYFIVERNYSPIILQGAKNEIWLENLDEDYRIIRIVSDYIHNNEQLEYDVVKAKKITDRIKKKTFSLKMKILSIYVDLGENAKLIENYENVDSVYLFDETSIEEYKIFSTSFPDINEKLAFSEEGMQLFLKITEDINSKNKNNAVKAEDVFKKKTPFITYFLIAVNVLVFLLFNLTGDYQTVLNDYCLYGPLVRVGEYYRIISCMFLHANIFHLLFNVYALYIIGSQIESYMGRFKYVTIYFVSGIFGSLLSMLISSNPSVGASGAIFGLLGSLLYFGYHYRVYLGNVLKSQIIPVILINLLYGFMVSGIDNAAHIGGLIGGFLITIGLGVKYKSTKFEMVNGLIVISILSAFLMYMNFIYIK